MKILSIDTSTADSSVALMENGQIMGEFTVNQKRTHSETLVPIIQNLLNLLGINVGEIDLFVVGIGPGSFTGIRIGMTVAKTLAQLTNKDIIGISSLKALAVNARAETILPIIDARGGRVYYALFDKDMNRLEEDSLIFADELSEKIQAYKDLVVIGDYNEEIKSDLDNSNISYAPAIHNNLIARGLCQLGLDRYNRGEVDDYRNLRANYVRKSQAERDLK